MLIARRGIRSACIGAFIIVILDFKVDILGGIFETGKVLSARDIIRILRHNRNSAHSS